MNPRRSLIRLVRAACLVALVHATPRPASGQTGVAPEPVLAPAVREALAQAADSGGLAPWQRGLMLDLSRDDVTAEPERPELAFQAMTAEEDGAWSQALLTGWEGHSTVYDPVGDRVIVFGGYSASGYVGDTWALSLSGTPAWTRLTPSGNAPSARAYQSAIYDPVRARILVYGGYSGGTWMSDVWALSLAGAPAWSQLTRVNSGPGPRELQSAIYDPVRDRMLVYGGYVSGSDSGGVWEMPLADTLWTRLSPSGTAPGNRYAHSAIYDPVRDRMVVYGGWSSTRGVLGDAWALSLAGTPAWSQLAPSGSAPAARGYHSAIYDAVADRMVVFGGYSGGPYPGDTWSLSLSGTAAWTQLSPAGTPPVARGYHGALYDGGRGRMVVFGGYSNSGYLGDTWALALVGSPAWTLVAPSGSPLAAREFHSAVYDRARDRIVVYGGYLGGALGDVWVLSLGGDRAWTQLMPTGTPPAARYGHSAVLDAAHDRMIVFGGTTAGGPSAETWALTLAGSPAWTQLAPTGTPPAARAYHSAIYDPVRGQMVVYGGYSSGYLGDAWTLSLVDAPAWTLLTHPGPQPGARRGHSAIYDSMRDRMVVFGGYSTAYLSDTWSFSIRDTIWAQLATSGGSPAPRLWHSAVYDSVRGRMIVFGGNANGAVLGDLWALPMAATAWTQLAPAGIRPTTREYHTAVFDPGHDDMVVFGGLAGNGSILNETWNLHFIRPAWAGVSRGPAEASALCAPAPNPSRGATTFAFTLPRAGRAELGVYDVSGRLVRELVHGERAAGSQSVTWNGAAESGARLPAGIYFVRLSGPGVRGTRRVVML